MLTSSDGDPRGVALCNAVSWNPSAHQRLRADHDVVLDLGAVDYRAVGAYEDVVADARSP